MLPMTPVRRLAVLVTALTGATLLTAGTSAPAGARTVDERCLGLGPVPASALDRAGDLGCSLVGRVVTRGRVSVVVPPPGVTVAGEGLSGRGETVGLVVTNTGRRVVVGGSTGAPDRRAASPGACKDRAFHLEGHHWQSGYRYRINLTRMPAHDRAKTVVAQVKAGNTNVRRGRNTCGRRAVRTHAATYLGRTEIRPNVTTDGSTVGCGAYNTKNVVGFGDLPGNLLGWTCFWWVGGGRINAADVLMDSGDELVTRLPATCTDRWDFEGAVTHEMGHVYGLGHTGSGHANLTMQHLLRPCSTYARTLGLGDWLGMKKMYGVR